MLFESILTSTSLTIQQALLCTVTSIVIGLIISLVYSYSGSVHSKSFAVTLVMLPALVQVVILMVNGNLGAGIAVAGAFSLVRFRSAPGTSREIAAIFFAMSMGLATGMGHLLFAVVITVLLSMVLFVLGRTPFGEGDGKERQLKITIPEELNDPAVFEETFASFTKTHSLEKIKTANLGSLFELTYHIRLKKAGTEKELIDALRCCNGNLPILCGKMHTGANEL